MALAADMLSKWKAQTSFASSPEEMRRNPLFKSLIRIGKPALPALAADLQREPSMQTMLALHAVTGAQPPYGESARGDIDIMAAAWLSWLSKNMK